MAQMGQTIDDLIIDTAAEKSLISENFVQRDAFLRNLKREKIQPFKFLSRNTKNNDTMISSEPIEIPVKILDSRYIVGFCQGVTPQNRPKSGSIAQFWPDPSENIQKAQTLENFTIYCG